MLTVTDYILRLSIAMVSGFLIGIERERKDKPAGLKTHMLVSIGASLFVLSALELVSARAANVGPTSIEELDLMRVVGGLIGGVGFLGAGAIIQRRGDIEGVTTASTIWVTAAVGMVCGLGQLRLAGVAIGAILVTLFIFGRLEDWLEEHYFRRD